MDLPLALTGYDISLWIHITAVVVGLGATFAESILLPVTMSVDKRHLPMAYFIPTDRKLEAMVTEEIAAAGDGPVELSDEYLEMSRVEGIMGSVTGLLIVVAIFLMVVKPGA